jgi:hypothetical protein
MFLAPGSGLRIHRNDESLHKGYDAKGTRQRLSGASVPYARGESRFTLLPSTVSQPPEVRHVFYWIYDIPTPQLAVLISGVFVGFFWIGCFLFRPILRTFIRARSGTNDIVGYILSCFGVFYGLLLGLIAVAAYQNLNKAEENVSREAVALTALYQDLAAYQDPVRHELRDELRNYCSYVIETAWPQQRKGIILEEGRLKILAFRNSLHSFVPQTLHQVVFHAETLGEFDHYYEARRLRLHDVHSGIPAVMWYVVIVGAVINLAIVWMFDMRMISQLMLGGMLAFFMGTMIFLIAAMDNPYRGEVSVNPDAFQEACQVMVSESGPPPAHQPGT